MRSQGNGFDRIAPYYDKLKDLVFGKAIHQSQVCFLDHILPGARILIIGGGSGEMLSLLNKINPLCRIWYVEASSAMLSLAARRVATAQHRITFIHGTEGSVPAGVEFDAIITHFFLDVFTAPKSEAVCRLLSASLSRQGIWLVSDFVCNRVILHRILLWLMYAFFRATCKIEARKLPDWQHHLRSAGMNEKYGRFFYRGFIRSSLYAKDV
jgi:tRNA (cmo5U34)-methyltransferase